MFGACVDYPTTSFVFLANRSLCPLACSITEFSYPSSHSLLYNTNEYVSSLRSRNTMTTIDISQTSEIYTVSRLNREARLLLEENFLSLWVEGEISNFTVPQSGHWYFSLKDEAAQIRCAMFKPQNRRLTFTPKEGMHVIAKGRVSLYEGRGDFQLLVDFLEDAGVGKLQKEFEALKKRLSEEGLFDTSHLKKYYL